VSVIAVGAMLYFLFTGEIPVRRRRPILRAEQPEYFWFLILIQLAIFVAGLLDWFGVIVIFNR
jgi:hypothetical protein